MITGENVVFVVIFIRDIRVYYAVSSRVLYSRIRISINFGIKGSERKIV
jgi:hypothetical protein